jgi:23S rRNA pseudouridine2605 synthase
MRLNRYLAACGLGSRRRCEEFIEAGRVRVNGEAAHFGMRVGAHDRVTVDEAPVTPPSQRVVWMLHKPGGVVCTADDPQGRATVLELAERHGVGQRVFPIGRLDLDTTGLLLLTNDGSLSHRLTHPSMGVEKEYEATVEHAVSELKLERLRAGVELEDGRSAPCRVQAERRAARHIVRLVVHEGRKRQVRRMLAAVGHPVLKLHRVRVGPLRLGTLEAGQLRRLDDREIGALLLALTPDDGAPAADAP